MFQKLCQNPSCPLRNTTKFLLLPAQRSSPNHLVWCYGLELRTRECSTWFPNHPHLMLCILMSKLQFKLCQNLRSLRAPIIFSSWFYGSHCSKTNYPPIEQPLSSSECFIAVTCLRINVVPNHPQLPMLPQDQLHHFPARIIGPEHTCPLRSPNSFMLLLYRIQRGFPQPPSYCCPMWD